jgi:parallel beta-helix repeat protein
MGGGVMKRKFVSISIVLVFIITMTVAVDLSFDLTPNATGATIYVDDDGGRDYTKIQDAINASSDGDTVYVYSGTYYENLRVDNSIILTGQGRTSTIIEGCRSMYVIFVLIDNVQISGFKIMGNNGSNYAGVMSSKDNITITNCEFRYNGRGIHLWVSSFHTVKNNICRNSVRDGMYIHGCDNVTLEDNLCVANMGNGILIHGHTDLIAKNNICNENERDGLQLHGVTNAIVENNQCFYNEDNGIHGHGRDNITVKDNLCTRNKDAGIFMHGVFNTTIRNNQCIYNVDSGIRGFGGEIALLRSNTCKNNQAGIKIMGVKYTTIEQNTCNFNREGVLIY